ncbi:MAG: toll/interleukin-1 receptor domain-containing protein, partial [Leptolyngbya sp. SIO3F4]|nr:toll/interleukin-1 receptor domain-containing protein [Leptolyngbya sp. SIO3F4]
MSGPGSIFISYRRSDSTAETERIHDRLVVDFGPDRVFQDVGNIPLGSEFADVLDRAVSQCQVVLVIIGKTWLTVQEPDGTRRLDNPDDFVRIEVESALKRKIPVIPVLVQGASMPRRSQLPQSLQGLAGRNGMEVGYNPRFRPDMDRLVKGLKGILGQTVSSSPAETKKSAASGPYVENLGGGVTLDMVYIPE